MSADGVHHMQINASGSSIPSTIPFRVAQAYGVKPAAQVSRISPAANGAAPITQTGAAQDSTRPSSELSAAGKRLVAGVVPGRVDFSGEHPVQSQPALQMYRHPADKNAAATGVAVGRKLDVAG
jgi:hypothetical protein